jgi:2',3'-cyclic-nucleotide 2'-phosphodiesterase (5'-nucleotidase family)
VTIGGQPLNPQKTYTLVTTKYVAEGGDGYDMLKGTRNVIAEKLIDSDVLRRAIATAKTIAPRTDGRIRRLDKPDAEKPCPPKAASAVR